MKVHLLLILAAIILAEARHPRKFVRGIDEGCSDKWAKKVCRVIALNRGCLEDDKAVNCAKTCRLCHDKCEDINPHYCKLEKEEGVLDCSREDMVDFCRVTCKKCDELSSSRAINGDGGQKLNRVRRVGCQDKEPDYCRQEKEEGALDCSREDMIDICRLTCNICEGCEDKEPDYCRQEKEEGALDCSHEDMIDLCRSTCDKCGEQSSPGAINGNGGQTLNRVKRAACEDLSKMCHEFDVCSEDELKDDELKACHEISVCGDDELKAYCLKTCNLCNERSNIARRKRGTEDPLMPLKRSKEACVDISSEHCKKVVRDGKCGLQELAFECPQSCGMCEQIRYLTRGMRKTEDELMPLLRTAGECKDDVDHCEEIYNRNLCGQMETNHICKLTCGLCKP